MGSMNTAIQPHSPQEASVLPVSNVSGNMTHAHQVNRTIAGLLCQVSSVSNNNTEEGQQQVSNRYTASVSIASSPITTPAIANNVAARPSNMPSNGKKNTTVNRNQNQQVSLPGVHQTDPSLQHTIHASTQSPGADATEEDGEAYPEENVSIRDQLISK